MLYRSLHLIHPEDCSVLVHKDLPHLFYCHIIFHFIGVSLIICKVIPVERHLGRLEYFAVINNAAVKILVVSW